MMINTDEEIAKCSISGGGEVRLVKRLNIRDGQLEYWVIHSGIEVEGDDGYIHPVVDDLERFTDMVSALKEFNKVIYDACI